MFFENVGTNVDPDGDQLTYSWRVISKPLRSTPKLTGANQQVATFSSSKSGKYVIGLKVYDGKVWSSEDKVTVIVSIRAVQSTIWAAFVAAADDLRNIFKVAEVEAAPGMKKSSGITAPGTKKDSIVPAPGRLPDREASLPAGRHENPLLWKDATSYHKTDWFEQQEAKDDFALANSPGSPYAQAVEKMRADRELVKLPTRVVKDSAASNATVNVSEISTKGAKASKGVTNSSADAKETTGGTESVTASTPRLISHGLYYHFTDHLGSSNIVTDEAGNIVEISDYYPYGKARVQEKTDPAFSNKKQFTGKEKDDSGLTYFGARYYDERVGRFTQVDSIISNLQIDRIEKLSGEGFDKFLSVPQNLNLYSYTSNNPVKFIDPTGNLKIHTQDASDEDIEKFNKALEQLIEDVENNDEIKEYFNIFGVDILDILSNDEVGPDVYIHEKFWLNENSIGGEYNTLTNDISINKKLYDKEDPIHSLKNTLIHELGHYANDVASAWGNLDPDISQQFPIVEWVLNYYTTKYPKTQKIIEEDGIYGYGSSIILYGTLN